MDPLMDICAARGLRLLEQPRRYAIALTAAFGAAGPGLSFAVPERDEHRASQFVYCACVTQFWFEYLTSNESAGASIDGYRLSRSEFLLAATLLSDREFVQHERPAAVQRLFEVAREQERTQSPLLAKEAMSCLATFEREAVPLLSSSRKATE
jgi:hypothetical protein